jgi:hypothetical protein
MIVTKAKSGRQDIFTSEMQGRCLKSVKSASVKAEIEQNPEKVKSCYNALFSNDAVAVIGERHADRTGMFLAQSRNRARALGRLESTRDKMVEIDRTNPQL